MTPIPASREDHSLHLRKYDAEFEERTTALLEWLAERAPERAARIVGSFLNDVAAERRPAVTKAT